MPAVSSFRGAQSRDNDYKVVSYPTAIPSRGIMLVQELNNGMQLDGLPDAEEPPIWKDATTPANNSTEMKRRLGIILSAWTSPKRLLSRGGKTAVLRAKGFFKPA
jgi:hypothetical protein